MSNLYDVNYSYKLQDTLEKASDGVINPRAISITRGSAKVPPVSWSAAAETFIAVFETADVVV